MHNNKNIQKTKPTVINEKEEKDVDNSSTAAINSSK